MDGPYSTTTTDDCQVRTLNGKHTEYVWLFITELRRQNSTASTLLVLNSFTGKRFMTKSCNNNSNSNVLIGWLPKQTISSLSEKRVLRISFKSTLALRPHLMVLSLPFYDGLWSRLTRRGSSDGVRFFKAAITIAFDVCAASDTHLRLFRDISLKAILTAALASLRLWTCREILQHSITAMRQSVRTGPPVFCRVLASRRRDWWRFLPHPLRNERFPLSLFPPVTLLCSSPAIPHAAVRSLFRWRLEQTIIVFRGGSGAVCLAE